MNKYLIVTMPDQTRWRIPASIIAQDRARYYAKLDEERGGGDLEDLFQLEYALTSGYELLDWASNNMNWEDVARYAEQLKAPAPDYRLAWPNAPKIVVSGEAGEKAL